MEYFASDISRHLKEPLEVVTVDVNGRLVSGKIVKLYTNTCLLVNDTGGRYLIHQSKVKQLNWKRKCTLRPHDYARSCNGTCNAEDHYPIA